MPIREIVELAKKRKQKAGPGGDKKKKLEPEEKSRWLAGTDIIAAGAYLLISFLLVYPIPGLVYSFDRMHHTSLFMFSVRILEGQVPFGDFHPWYGPLYHYFHAFWVWLMGVNLLSIKYFLHVVSPIISVAMLIGAFRLFRLSWQGRLFAMVACGLWGIDRIIHCGSTRSLLGLLLIAAWSGGLRKPWGKWARFAVFPSVLFALFYSPDIGVYMTPAAVVFAAGDVLSIERAQRRVAALYYGAGALASASALILLFFGTVSIRNYFGFFTYTSSNMIWAYGNALPGPAEIAEDLNLLIYFLPPLILTGMAVRVLWSVKNRSFAATHVWIPACIIYGAALWTSTYVRTSNDHLVYSLPPTLAILALLFQERRRYEWMKILLAILIIANVSFFDVTRKRNTIAYRYWEIKADPNMQFPGTDLMAGVLVDSGEAKMVAQIRKFCDERKNDGIIFPLHSFEAWRVGCPLNLPLDDFSWMSNPDFKRRLMDRIKSIDARYVIIDTGYMFSLYLHEDTDDVFDYIVDAYQPIKTFGSTIIYEKLPSPVKSTAVIQEMAGPITLDRSNGYSVEWEIPRGLTMGYVEMDEKFVYSPSLLQRVSCPEVKMWIDGKALERRQKHGHGMERIRTTASGGIFRAYLPKKGEKVKLTVTFPGSLNFRPEKVEIMNVRFHQFNFKPAVPYTDSFLGKWY